MRYRNILISAKTSGLRRYQNRTREYRHEAERSLLAQHRSVSRSFGSDDRQAETLKRLQAAFPNATWVSHDALTPDDVAASDLFISAGGDETLKRNAQFVRNSNVPMVAINIDPVLSAGALNAFTANDIELLKLLIERDELTFEEWPTMDVFENGERIGSAVTEIGIYERERTYTSRQVLGFKGKEARYSGGGLIVANGAGSTGWQKAVGRYRLPDGTQGYSLLPFARDERRLRWAVSETSCVAANGSCYLERGDIREGDVLRVVSQNDEDGIISLDPGTRMEIPFPAGAAVEIRLGSSNLRVAKRPEVLLAA